MTGLDLAVGVISTESWTWFCNFIICVIIIRRILIK